MSDEIRPCSTINGNSLAIDPETGFLVPMNGYKLEGFDATKKARFIDLVGKFWPRIGAVCDAVGVSRQTYYNHYKIDAKFREMVDLQREEKLDSAEAAMVDNSTRPGGFMDRIALLKAYRPERWNPEHRLSVTHDVQVTRAIADKARQIIDTTATKGD